jgi:hypothetical protein
MLPRTSGASGEYTVSVATTDWDRWEPGTQAPETQVRNLFRAVLGLHSTFTDEIWLWRGQADQEHLLAPAVHTRVRESPGLAFDEANAIWATTQLLERARASRLDRIGEFQMPDLALLAHLRHHGAATPLLDVSVDPLVGLWMATHASGPSVNASDDHDGLLFAIRRPPDVTWLEPLDSRAYFDGSTADVASAISGRKLHWYRPPDVSERLRIQRGSFLVGPIANSVQSPTSLPLKYRSNDGPWVARRIDKLGQAGQPVKAVTDVAVFVVRSGLKPRIRTWLSERAGLTVSTVYPTPWNRPFLDQFCTTYGRLRPIDF